MNDKSEKVIQTQGELIAGLEKQLAADQTLIDAQKRQIQVQQEQIALLEEEKRTLTEAGNGLAAANEKLEKICMEQQELLETFSGLFENMEGTQP